MLMVSCLCVYILKYFGMMLRGHIIKNEKKKEQVQLCLTNLYSFV